MKKKQKTEAQTSNKSLAERLDDGYADLVYKTYIHGAAPSEENREDAKASQAAFKALLEEVKPLL